MKNEFNTGKAVWAMMPNWILNSRNDTLFDLDGSVQGDSAAYAPLSGSNIFEHALIAGDRPDFWENMADNLGTMVSNGFADMRWILEEKFSPVESVSQADDGDKPHLNMVCTLPMVDDSSVISAVENDEPVAERGVNSAHDGLLPTYESAVADFVSDEINPISSYDLAYVLPLSHSLEADNFTAPDSARDSMVDSIANSGNLLVVNSEVQPSDFFYGISEILPIHNACNQLMVETDVDSSMGNNDISLMVLDASTNWIESEPTLPAFEDNNPTVGFADETVYYSTDVLPAVEPDMPSGEIL
ncbi:hypothetical protein [Pasteurella testudinis]|uniref:hypothetical protein n=1 Tax=Pasteurella testudinis TaxID=761 RepID=UPI0040583A32